MITIDTIKSLLFFSLLISPFALAVVNLAHSIYISYRHLDTITAALANSRYIFKWTPLLRNQGWIGSVIVVGRIAGMMIMPKSAIRAGDLNESDFSNFPATLKRSLVINSAMTLISFSGILLVGAALKLM